MRLSAAHRRDGTIPDTAKQGESLFKQLFKVGVVWCCLQTVLLKPSAQGWGLGLYDDGHVMVCTCVWWWGDPYRGRG